MKQIERNGYHVYPILFPLNYGAMKSINCFLFNDGKKLTLVDAGIDHQGFKDFFEEALKQFKLSIQDIDQIYLTHHHEDHVGLVNDILRQKQMPIFAHHLAIPRLTYNSSFLNNKKEFFLKLYEQYGCMEIGLKRIEKMDQTYLNRERLKIKGEILPLSDGETIDNFEIIEVPGHSPDSIIFYNKAAEWQFSGDLLLEKVSTNALIDFDDNLELLPTVAQYEQSLLKCNHLATKWIFPGHQDPFQQHNVEIQKKLQRIQKKENRVIEAIGKGHHRMIDVAKSLYGNRIEKEEFSLILSEVIGYLEYATNRGKLVRKMRNGQWYFERV